jgi:hypothetical protein
VRFSEEGMQVGEEEDDDDTLTGSESAGHSHSHTDEARSEGSGLDAKVKALGYMHPDRQRNFAQNDSGAWGAAEGSRASLGSRRDSVGSAGRGEHTQQQQHEMPLKRQAWQAS